MKNFLLIRFSAMGDAILAAQVARAALDENPDLHLHVLTRPAFRPFFGPTDRISFVEVDLSGRHKGLRGLYRLFREIKANAKLDGILDLHNVLRSRVLGLFFSLAGVPVFVLKKHREERKKLTRKHNTILKALTPISQSMKEVWLEAGFDFTINAPDRDSDIIFRKRIGIAPTASTPTKTYPLESMKEVVARLVEEEYYVYIFGGGEKDKKIAKELSALNGERVYDCVEGYSLESQMELMSTLAIMLTMDSSNMHMARMLGLPVLSIWGATHPFGGYGPLGQDDEELRVEIPTEQLSCRPCSIFGEKDCYRDRMYCLEDIPPSQVLERLEEALKKF